MPSVYLQTTTVRLSTILLQSVITATAIGYYLLHTAACCAIARVINLQVRGCLPIWSSTPVSLVFRLSSLVILVCLLFNVSLANFNENVGGENENVKMDV